MSEKQPDVKEPDPNKEKILKAIKNTLDTYEQFSTTHNVTVHDSAETAYRVEIRTNGMGRFEKVLEALTKIRYKPQSIEFYSMINDPEHSILVKIWV